MKSVLLVLNELFNTSGLADSLYISSDEKVKVSSVPNLEAAMKLDRQKEFDLVVVDGIHLPLPRSGFDTVKYMNGYEPTYAVETLEEHRPGINVAVLESPGSGPRAGGHQYISAPAIMGLDGLTKKILGLGCLKE